MENVSRHLEGMYDEFSEMERLQLFDQSEINKIKRFRKEFEYKVNGVNKNLVDFKAYIKHERDLMKQIKLRRDKKQIAERKGNLDAKVMKRIRTLYEVAIQKFPNDYALSLAYFKYCKVSTNAEALRYALNNLIKNHSHNSATWILIAKYYAYEKKNIKDAISHLHKGLRIHKEPQMYRTALEFELFEARTKRPAVLSEQELAKEKILNLKLKNYLETIFQDVNDFNFYIEILDMLQKYPSTKDAQDVIVQKLLQSHSNEDVVWHALAQRELKQLNNKDSDQEKTSSKQILEQGFKKYQEGLKILSGEKKTALWRRYLDCLMDFQNNTNVASKLKTSTLHQALEDACEEDILDNRHYIMWIELLDNKMDEAVNENQRQQIQEEIIDVLEKGLEAIPDSVELWKLRMKAAVMTDIEKEVNETMKRGIQALKDKSLPIWLMALRFHVLSSDEKTIDEFYQSATYAPREVCSVLKPQYILWLGMNKPVQDVRAKYKLMAKQTPYCKELHNSMLKVENNQLQPDEAEIEKIHKNACDQFGTEDVDVWINYAQFLSKHKPNEVSNLYQRAESKLDKLLFSDFQEKYISLEEYNKICSGDPANDLFKVLNAASKNNNRMDKEIKLFPDYVQEEDKS
ncbi:U3 small nucleolar RNA-associated protein 6 homolog [Aethina tumida]|uniref:U3 small nucleolar RNA-associated protein 6 homolog n=1 Tax=Aethina tumida TaxID=116153 RepID=UPI00096B5454|nr:U3 small nucleolar RNA-associated protein 6 homolog [Aethina tumida]